MVEFKDGSEPQSVDSEKVRNFWPQILIRFFEKRISWKRLVHFEDQETVDGPDGRQDTKPIGEPIEIECKYFKIIGTE